MLARHHQNAAGQHAARCAGRFITWCVWMYASRLRLSFVGARDPLHVVAPLDGRRSVRPRFGLRLRRESGGARAAPPDNPPRLLWSVQRSPCTLSVGAGGCSVVDRAGASWFKVHRPGAPPVQSGRLRLLRLALVRVLAFARARVRACSRSRVLAFARARVRAVRVRARASGRGAFSPAATRAALRCRSRSCP